MRPIPPLLLGAALLSLGTLRAHAQASYDACYVPTVGAIYLIKQAGLPASCLAAAHKPFSWISGGTVADGSVTLAKLAFDPATQTELDSVMTGLAAAGTLNTPTNPVDWTQLKNVPPGFADGTDDGAGGTSDHGGLAGLTDDDHPRYLVANGARSATDGFAVTGTFGTGALAVSGVGARLVWYPGKGAFRVGEALGPNWDDANIGPYSVGLGVNTLASGTGSLAVGSQSSATGYYRFRETTGHPTDEQIGLAAQEVERVLPQLVHRDSEGKLSVAYTQLAAVLVRAVQEQQELQEALRAELAALRGAAAGGSK